MKNRIEDMEERIVEIETVAKCPAINEIAKKGTKYGLDHMAPAVLCFYDIDHGKYLTKDSTPVVNPTRKRNDDFGLRVCSRRASLRNLCTGCPICASALGGNLCSRKAP